MLDGMKQKGLDSSDAESADVLIPASSLKKLAGLAEEDHGPEWELSVTVGKGLGNGELFPICLCLSDEDSICIPKQQNCFLFWTQLK